MLVSKDVSFSVGNHDFTQFNIVPSVALVVETPDTVSQSIYCHQVVLTLKDGAFQPSSAVRHCVEVFSALKQHGYNSIPCPVLALYTGSGPITTSHLLRCSCS